MRPRVAIVGAGPAGAFAAGALMSDYGDIEVDLFERLPTPWGLLRGGVAPDHQEIKRLEDSFAAETFQRGARFLGNVAADVIRMLTLSAEELGRTDIADHALEVLRASRIEEVVVLGRRGPAQAAFTSAELRELGRLDGVAVAIGPGEATLDSLSEEWLAGQGTFTARKNVELVREFAAREPQGDARRRIVLRFLQSPVEIRGDGKVEAVDIRRNELVRSEDGAIRARATDDQIETIDCGLVLRSVGYQAVPLPGVPFDERAFVLPNDQGRVRTPDGEPLPGVYAVGWIKRGPTGILGTNKRDAQETVRCLADDLRANALPQPAQPTREAVDALLAERKPDLVTVDGWRAIAAHELERGRAERRPRVKLASRDELLAAADPGA